MPTSNIGVALDKFTTFGDLLKYLRRRAGLTQLELSIAVGYSDTQISRFEQNRRWPDLATIEARFVPALHLEHDPDVVARLLELIALPETQSPPEIPRPTPARQHNLPAPLTRFIGRKQQIAEVRALLAQARLVTLTGMGGCGKTRLALQVAAHCVDELTEGVWLVELAAVSEPTQVPHAVMAALSVGTSPGESPTTTLLHYLRDKALLLVLDNCEHLAEACASFAETLLRACPALKILATSREALSVPGEIIWSVPPLSLPDPRRAFPTAPDFVKATYEAEAAQLFAERARAALPTFCISATNALAVAQICRRLDGLPLALELAAARLRVLSVEQIAMRLDDCFQLLTAGQRTAEPRQQTLRATFDWSYHLLTEAEQTLLRRLAIFASGWSLAAAEAVCADVPGADPAQPQVVVEARQVLDLLTELVNKSLVVAQADTGEMRYRLLDTIRQYARERLHEAHEASHLHGRYRWWRWRNRMAQQANAH